ncbi:hypothetical protein [Ketogulonicigenium robustum]|nr:hypothetical protein [Ketogulonicigenium robustum]
MKAILTAVIALCAAVFAGLAQAQTPSGPFGVEAGASTLGLYAAPSFAPGDSTTIRLPIFFGGLEDEFDVDGTRLRGDLDVQAMGVVADYRLYRGLYLSTGLLFGGYAFDGHADTISTDSGDITGDFRFQMRQTRNVAPVLALGYRYAFFSGMTLRAEVGAKLVKHALKVDGISALSPADRADVEGEIARLNADLDDLPVVPFITLAVGVLF